MLTLNPHYLCDITNILQKYSLHGYFKLNLATLRIANVANTPNAAEEALAKSHSSTSVGPRTLKDACLSLKPCKASHACVCRDACG